MIDLKSRYPNEEVKVRNHVSFIDSKLTWIDFNAVSYKYLIPYLDAYCTIPVYLRILDNPLSEPMNRLKKLKELVKKYKNLTLIYSTANAAKIANSIIGNSDYVPITLDYTVPESERKDLSKPINNHILVPTDMFTDGSEFELLFKLISYTEVNQFHWHLVGVFEGNKWFNQWINTTKYRSVMNRSDITYTGRTESFIKYLKYCDLVLLTSKYRSHQIIIEEALHSSSLVICPQTYLHPASKFLFGYRYSNIQVDTIKSILKILDSLPGKEWIPFRYEMSKFSSSGYDYGEVDLDLCQKYVENYLFTELTNSISTEIQEID